MRPFAALRGCLRLIPLLSVLAGGSCLAQSAEGMKRINLPALKPVELKPYAALEIPAHLEPSGLVKSRLWPDVYWTHNDSGDGPRIFPVHRDGRIYPAERYGAAHGVHIPDAVNVDWEDITADDQGHLIIGDFGNSEKNDRRDLCDLLGVVRPDPTKPAAADNAYVPEAKQGVEKREAAEALAHATKTKAKATRKGHPQRGRAAWDEVMRKARGQAE